MLLHILGVRCLYFPLLRSSFSTFLFVFFFWNVALALVLVVGVIANLPHVLSKQPPLTELSDTLVDLISNAIKVVGGVCVCVLA